MKNYKFTWIDGLIIAVVLLLIAGTCLKFFVLDSTAVTKDPVEFSYQIKISGIRQFTLDALEVGDAVFDDEGKGQVGVITDISVDNALSTATFPDGSAKNVLMENRFDVTLTLSAQGVPENGTYKVGTYTISVNQNNAYFTKYSTWSGKIVSIEGATQ